MNKKQLQNATGVCISLRRARNTQFDYVAEVFHFTDDPLTGRGYYKDHFFLYYSKRAIVNKLRVDGVIVSRSIANC